jgi:membrane protease YdiL (CAAX protease family)
LHTQNAKYWKDGRTALVRGRCYRFPRRGEISLLGAGVVALPVDRPESIPVDWWSVDLRVTNLAAREFVEVGLLAVLLRFRGVRFLDLGFKKPGTKMAWVVALLVLALGLLSHPFVRNGGPYPLAGYTIFAALMMGIPVALIEESIYRGFAITTLQASGFGMPVQILVPGIIFGLVHVSYVSTDWTVPVFTGILGCVWSWIYIVGRNSIWPTLVAHMINDAVIMPYFYLHHVY